MNKQKDHWDKQAEFWAQEVRSGKDVYRDLFNNPAFFKFVGDIKGKRVLDAGCGEGYNTRLFAQQGAHITGIDLSENMIRLAQEEEKQNPLGIDYNVASFTDLSIFEDNSFDTVLSTMALMDGPGYEQALQEFYRVLKPGGSLFFSLHHPCFSPPHYTWIKNERGEKIKIVSSGYFEEGPWEMRFALTKKTDKSDTQELVQTRYHRTLSTYINQLMQVGFVLKKIQEPVPTQEACKKSVLLKKARDVVAMFLYVHGIKLGK